MKVSSGGISFGQTKHTLDQVDQPHCFFQEQFKVFSGRGRYLVNQGFEIPLDVC